MQHGRKKIDPASVSEDARAAEKEKFGQYLKLNTLLLAKVGVRCCMHVIHVVHRSAPPRRHVARRPPCRTRPSCTASRARLLRRHAQADGLNPAQESRPLHNVELSTGCNFASLAGQVRVCCTFHPFARAPRATSSRTPTTPPHTSRRRCTTHIPRSHLRSSVWVVRSDDERRAILAPELALSQDALANRNPKSYCAWHHRKWVVDT